MNTKHRGGRRASACLLPTLALVIAFSATPAHAAGIDDIDGDGTPNAADCSPLDPAVHPGATDRPDLQHEDMNCDGVDGDVARAVFVTLGGSDAAPGTITNPVRTVGHAVALAAPSGRDVYVAGGQFDETVPAADGVGIYGGYEPITGRRSDAQATIIKGAPAILAQGDRGVVLQSLALQGAPDADGNAYAIRAVPSGAVGSTVALEDVTATGLAGLAGSNGGAGLGGSFSSGFGGGGGGLGGTCAGVLGQSGGVGAGPAQAPNAGFFGNPGRDGSTGAAAANDPVAAPTDVAAWPRRTANGGSTGGSGNGGNGGSGGNGDTNFSCLQGGQGGAGGAGGGGGRGGGGGQDGAGSFGAYVLNSSLVAVTSRLAGGTGGHGGNGGAGGLGGFGAPGNAGGVGQCLTVFITVCAQNGFPSGAGGRGGTGGPGGGGAGGPSAGVLQAGPSSAYASRGGSAESGGTPGGGGARGNGGPTAPTGTSVPVMRSSSAPATSAADFDGDGVTDTSDACPTVAASGSAAGCPARPAKIGDSDGDGVYDTVDACPSSAATADADHDGCTDPAPAGTGAPAVTTTTAITPPVAKPRPALTYKVVFVGSKTKLKALSLKGVAAGSTVTATCAGRGCSKKKLVVKRAKTTVSLTALVKKALAPGAKITVVITRPGAAKVTRTLKTRARKAPLST